MELGFFSEFDVGVCDLAIAYDKLACRSRAAAFTQSTARIGHKAIAVVIWSGKNCASDIGLGDIQMPNKLSLMGALRNLRYHSEKYLRQPGDEVNRSAFEDSLWSARRALSEPLSFNNHQEGWRKIVDKHVSSLATQPLPPDKPPPSLQALRDECRLLLDLLNGHP